MILVSEKMREGTRLVTGCIKNGAELQCIDCAIKLVCEHKNVRIETRCKNGQEDNAGSA